MKKYFLNKQNIYILLVLLGFFISLFLISDPIYFNPDDMVIIAIYSGKLGFTPSNDAIFMSSILGTIFKNLYFLNSNIPWYSLTLYFLHLISLVIGFKLILNIYQSLYIRLFCILCFFSLYLFIFYRLSFTGTSLFLWFMLMLFILYLNLKGKVPNTEDLVLGFLLIFSFLIRPSVPLGVFAFSLPTLISCMLPGVKKRFAYAILPVLIVMMLSTFLGDFIISSQKNDEYYGELQSARSRLTDTSDRFEGTNTEEAISAAGWTKADYLLASVNYWTHDEEVYSLERINMFLKHNRDFILPVSLLMFLISIIRNIWYLVIVLAALFLLVGLKDNENQFKAIEEINTNNKLVKWLISIVLLMLLSGFLYLASYRLPLHVSIPLLIYLYLLFIVLSPILYQYYFRGLIFLNLKPKFIIVVLIVVLCTINTFYQIISYSKLATAKKNLQNESVMDIKENYGEDIVFVGITRDRYLSYAHPLKEYCDIAEFKILPNVWLVGTEVYYKFLENLGVDSGQKFMKNAINNDDVVFRFRETPYIQLSNHGMYFKEHINEHYGYLFPDSYLEFDIILEKEIDNGLMLYFFKIKSENY